MSKSLFWGTLISGGQTELWHYHSHINKAGDSAGGEERGQGWLQRSKKTGCGDGGCTPDKDSNSLIQDSAGMRPYGIWNKVYRWGRWKKYGWKLWGKELSSSPNLLLDEEFGIYSCGFYISGNMISFFFFPCKRENGALSALLERCSRSNGGLRGQT